MFFVVVLFLFLLILTFCFCFNKFMRFISKISADWYIRGSSSWDHVINIYLVLLLCVIYIYECVISYWSWIFFHLSIHSSFYFFFLLFHLLIHMNFIFSFQVFLYTFMALESLLVSLCFFFSFFARSFVASVAIAIRIINIII